jgi:hypothetical protein
MTTYKCDGFKSVQAEDMKQAARIFAERQARREYGKRGYCHHVNQDSYSQDGNSATYQAFIGVYNKNYRSTNGENIWLTVYK